MTNPYSVKIPWVLDKDRTKKRAGDRKNGNDLTVLILIINRLQNPHPKLKFKS